MARIEDEFKKRFNDQELSGEGFDNEGLWDAISSQMDVESTTEKGLVHPGKPILLNFLFLGIVLVCLVYFIVDIQESNQQSISDITYSKEINEEEGILSGSPEKPVTDHNLTTFTSSELVSKPKKPAATKTKKADVPVSSKNQNTKPSAISIVEIKQTSSIKQSPSSSIVKNYFKESLPPVKDNWSSIPSKTKGWKELPGISNSNSTLTLSENNEIATSSHNTKHAIDQLKRNALKTIRLASMKEITIDLLVPPSSNNSTAKNKKRFAVEIDVWAGINSSIFSFKPDNSIGSPALATIKEASETGNLGGSMGLTGTVLFNDRFLIGAGFEYHQLQSKFDHSIIDSIQILKEDQILTLWKDGVTGDTLKVEKGDLLVDAVSTRKVIHHNKFQRFSIPIQIGLQQQTQKIVYGITAGGVFNFTFRQSGKTIDKDREIALIEEDRSSSSIKPFNMGLRIHPFVGYRISEHMSIKIHPQWTWVPNTIFKGTDIKQNTHHFNLNVGVGYSF